MSPLLSLPELKFCLEVEDKHETHVRNDLGRDEGSKEKQEGGVLVGRGMWWLGKPLSGNMTRRSQSKSEGPLFQAEGAVCESSLKVQVSLRCV